MSECRCNEVGPQLRMCHQCNLLMAPWGRSTSMSGAEYCCCEDRLWDKEDKAEVMAFLDKAKGRSGLWPGERWGDSLPCIGKAKCK